MIYANRLKKINWKKFFYSIFLGNTPSRKLFLFYLYAIIFGIILLSLPISLETNEYEVVLSDGTTKPYQIWDAILAAVSSFCDVGLISFNISKTYNFFGEFVMLMLMQIGGLGLFVIYWMFWNLLFNNIIYKRIKGIPKYESNKIGYTNSLLIFSERGNSKLGLTKNTIKTAIIFIFLTEIVFAFIYTMWFYFAPNHVQVDASIVYPDSNLDPNIWYINSSEYIPEYHNIGKSIWTGIFQSISTMNQAGFDLLGTTSCSTFRNGIGTIIQYFIIIQILIGGVGYPVFYDFIQWIKYKHHKQPFVFSLFTKISVTTYFLLLVIGLIFVISFEFCLSDSIINTVNSNPNLKDVYFGSGKTKNWNELTYVVFTVVSSRCTGFSTVNIDLMSESSKWIIIILMFIGCAPSTMGGGVRTTTFAIAIVSIFNLMRGNKTVVMFKRTIPKTTVNNSLIITMFGVIFILIFSIISYSLLVSTNSSFTNIIFEYASAFGTVGLSTGITSLLIYDNAAVYITIILLCATMIIGQLGISTSIFTFNNKETTKIIKYSEEDVKI